jgi:hypothetical protein
MFPSPIFDPPFSRHPTPVTPFEVSRSSSSSTAKASADFSIGIDKKVGNQFYSVPTLSGEKFSEGRHFGLENNTTFRVNLINTGPTEADVALKVDGNQIGIYRVPAHTTFGIERSEKDSRAMIFVREESQEAREIGAVTGASNNGLIEATFKPRKKREIVMYNSSNSSVRSKQNLEYDCDGEEGCFGDLETLRYKTEKGPFGVKGGPRLAAQEFSASQRSQDVVVGGGAVALGGNTSQTFRTIPDIPESEIDQNRVVTFSVRLLAVENTPPRLEAIATANLKIPAAPPATFAQMQNFF